MLITFVNSYLSKIDDLLSLLYDFNHKLADMIDRKLLDKYGAEERLLKKGELIFEEGNEAKYYYEVIEGEVLMSNLNSEGKEFIQGIFSEGRSFGEPPVLGNFTYPSNAIAKSNTKVIRLRKEQFLILLKENASIHLQITTILAKRLQYKAIMSSEISLNPPYQRIVRLFDYLKHTIYEKKGSFSYEVELTRQQIADLIGLRVETVIKTIKSMEKKKILIIKHRKIFY